MKRSASSSGSKTSSTRSAAGPPPAKKARNGKEAAPMSRDGSGSDDTPSDIDDDPPATKGDVKQLRNMMKGALTLLMTISAAISALPAGAIGAGAAALGTVCNCV